MNLDAILRIGAKVSGTEQVAKLQSGLKAAEGAAQSLSSRTGLLSGALGAVVPAVTVGGLAALVGKTIEAGDALNDMSQRTGVSVEALAKFKKAAATSGTDIDTVAKNLAKLGKGMYEAVSTGKGGAAEALQTLGISAKDAAGNLKSADQVTLEVANKFKAMPDGVEKTALAMKLFGKSGADMIPMLNMGGKAIDSLSVKMTTAFAQKADDYQDKLARLSGKVGGLAAGLTVALLPALDLIATGLTGVIDGFSKLPEPVQAIIGGAAALGIALAALAPVFASLITVAAAFKGLTIGATIAGWLGAIGPLITTVGTLVAGIVGWPLLIGAALVAIGILIYSFRDQIGEVLTGIGKAVYGAADGVNQAIRNAIGAAWDWLKGRFDALTGWIGGLVEGAGKALGSMGGAIRSAIGVAWDWLKGRFDALSGWIGGLVQSAGRLLGGLGEAIRAPFAQAAGAIRGVLSTVVGAIVGAVNGVIGQINRAIGAANNLASALRLPQLPFMPSLAVPSFEGGGYTGPGARSGGLDGRGGFVAMLHPRETVIDHATAGGGAAPAITIKTGPVMQMADGSQWVSMADLEQAMQATAAGVFRQLRSPSSRLAMGGA